MRIGRRQFAWTGGILLGTRGALADAGDLFARIGRAREHVHTLQGPFEQVRTIGLLATDVRSHGRLALVRPDRLRWELDPPDDVTFWVGPEGLAFRSAHGRGSVRSAGGGIGVALADLRALFGGDLTGLQARWELHVTRDDAAGAEFEASPRPGAIEHLQHIRFSLAPDLARPTHVLLVEGPRDRTLIDFGAVVVNAPVDDARMRPPT
jgi:Outer membrane lipoprotein carrier protein LolA